MTHNIELDDRKKGILTAIVEDYLRTAEPVGSRTIGKDYISELSPATIRNEMADLEDAGLIMQPHTSAGRIPTDRGYRYYVDHLMKNKPLSQKEEDFISQQLEESRRDLEDLLHRSLKVVAHLTHYTAIMSNLTEHLRIYSSGVSNILRQPEFNSVDRLSKILRALEAEEKICQVLGEYTKEEDNETETTTIRIGTENKLKEMQDCGVVVTHYEIKGKAIGGLGVIGPTRMPYTKIRQVVNYVSQKLNEITF
ncbi:MAG: heat-inducible transcriptional repressor HrcA [Candidatus Saganbacteria bacterium]|nr:heat-inducible transcriptional repressor HrcA [Candidatus Saganbacteria bacterium]